MVSLGFVSINDARCQAQQWVNNRSDGLQILLVFFKQNSWGSTLHPTWGGGMLWSPPWHQDPTRAGVVRSGGGTDIPLCRVIGLPAGWLCGYPSPGVSPKSKGGVRHGILCKLLGMQGLLGSLRSFAYRLLGAESRSGAAGENKREAEPEVWQAQGLRQKAAGFGRKEAILNHRCVNK